MRGVRQRRPSEKVNEHKDTRSFGLREDIKVSLELSFGIAYGEEPAGHPCRQTDGTKQKRPGLAGAQVSTRILYHNGSAGQAKKLGAKERKVKTRSLRTEGCGTPRVSAPPATVGGRPEAVFQSPICLCAEFHQRSIPMMSACSQADSGRVLPTR